MNQLRAASQSPAPPAQVPPTHPPTHPQQSPPPDNDEYKSQLAEEAAEKRKKDREQQRKEMRQMMNKDRRNKHRSASKGDNFVIEIMESPRKDLPPTKPKDNKPIPPPAEPKAEPSNDNDNDNSSDEFEEPEPVPIPPSAAEAPHVETPPFYRSKSVPSLSPKKHTGKEDNINSEENTDEDTTSSSSSSSSSESSSDLVNTFVNVEVLQKDIALPHKTSYIPNTMAIGDSDDEESVEEIKEESKNEVIDSEEERKDNNIDESKLSDDNNNIENDLSDSLDQLAPEDLAEAQQDMEQMVTIMQGILEKRNDPKSHSEDEEDEDEENNDNGEGEDLPIKESENETKEDKMHIFGVTINPSVLKRYVSDTSNAQSDYYRIEALRIYLEKELGDDVYYIYILYLFIEIY